MSDPLASGFGKFVPGFDFLQSLASQAAGGIAQGIGQNLPQLPNLGHWVAPTFSVEELDKRIEELRAVHFWLDQNAKALGATIQALEVQKMTLSTLKSMNFSMGDVAQAFKVKPADPAARAGDAQAKGSRFAGLEVPPRTYGSAPAPEAPRKAARKRPASRTASPAASASSPGTAPQAPGGVVDPMQWWGALTQQFQQIAGNALKDAARQGALDATRQAASDITGVAVKTATDLAGQAARTAAGTVGRGVGAAAGVGRAAAKAVTGVAKPAQPPRKKAAPRSR